MSKAKTDNSHLEAKVLLRVNHLPEKDPVRVLDCFHGSGIIWKNVILRCPNRKILVTGIEEKRGLPGLYLVGDNRKYLSMMDLSQFDVIDLDAYVVPFDQIEILMIRPGQRTVFVTFIQSNYGQLPLGMLECLGYTKSMVIKCPTLFCRNGFEKMKAYLAKAGLSQLWVRKPSYGKYYFCFEQG